MLGETLRRALELRAALYARCTTWMWVDKTGQTFGGSRSRRAESSAMIDTKHGALSTADLLVTLLTTPPMPEEIDGLKPDH